MSPACGAILGSSNEEPKSQRPTPNLGLQNLFNTALIRETHAQKKLDYDLHYTLMGQMKSEPAKPIIFHHISNSSTIARVGEYIIIQLWLLHLSISFKN